MGPGPQEARFGLPSLVRRWPGPRSIFALRDEVRCKLARAYRAERQPPDRYGFAFDTAVRLHVVMGCFHRWYFRSRCFGIDRLPPPPVLLVANHGSHVLSWDGANILSACLLQADPPRLVRAMADRRLMELPILGRAARRIGAVSGQRAVCIDLLQSGSTVLTFPEGARALLKPFRQRYQLSPFGEGFLHAALSARVPIVPVAVIGSEEEAPLLFNARRLARLLRTPVAPITPTLVIPLPVRYRIYFGRAMSFEGAATSSRVRQAVEEVRSSLRALLLQGIRERRSLPGCQGG